MTTFGTNMKLTAASNHRDALHVVLTEALGCKSMSPEAGLSIYTFDDGFNLGVYFVEPEDALPDEDQVRGPWLELLVRDVPARHAALRKMDVVVVPYARDPEHTYYRLPGGPVFRLAPHSNSSTIST